MLLTVYLSIVILAAVTVMMLSAVAFIQDEKMFSSAPKEVRELIRPRETELFYGARTIGWTLLIFSILMIIGALVIAAWDGIRSGFAFWQFFIRFLVLFTVYKVYDMIFFDYFWLLKFRFFQYYYPEAGDVMEGRKYGFNIKSQLLKLLVIFPAVSALAAWVCSLISL